MRKRICAGLVLAVVLVGCGGGSGGDQVARSTNSPSGALPAVSLILTSMRLTKAGSEEPVTTSGGVDQD